MRFQALHPGFAADNVDPMVAKLQGLYLITRPCGTVQALCRAVEQALLGGARVVQYRDKSDHHGRRREEAGALLALCRKAGAPLIVNDDVALARAIGADGVHLGAGDASIEAARQALGDAALIGVSCHDDLPRAVEAAGAGADYVSFGAFYPSPTKPEAVRAPQHVLVEAKTTLHIPLCAIGGITPDNAAPLIAAGADMIAAVSGVFDAADIQAAATRYAALFE